MQNYGSCTFYGDSVNIKMSKEVEEEDLTDKTSTASLKEATQQTLMEQSNKSLSKYLTRDNQQGGSQSNTE